ncbi:hypothetical protein [Roseateles oligotrophus]|uniref:PEP-CTERM protein-sorting domain-containing protein n=1 Tax=Roseateles oligotrophus TaxID=1769250 RepID=A0ABT2YI65_9BURK|nr:hypothetical protein [Roseateles oligotrophus]MCV2369753.1 hypothetical protein [Roseateles oligotrophus]
MRLKTQDSVVRLCLFVAALLAVEVSLAAVVTHGSLAISNIRINAAAGQLLIDPWSAQASATTNNSLGESSGQFDGPSNAAQANAAVTWATGHSSADATNPGAIAGSAVELPGKHNQADSSSAGALFTSFMITGGTGAVDVSFELDLIASQDGWTDDIAAVVRNELVASLSLDAFANPLLFFDSIYSIGPNSSFSRTLTSTLSGTASLFYDTPYWVFIEADSESNAKNLPEPGSLMLVLFGGLAMGLSRARSARNSHCPI